MRRSIRAVVRSSGMSELLHHASSAVRGRQCIGFTGEDWGRLVGVKAMGGMIRLMHRTISSGISARRRKQALSALLLALSQQPAAAAQETF